MKFRVGDWVEVRRKEEILVTLDKRGRMDGLPFMPQMFQYCGKKFQVFRRAHKTCDFVYKTWGRSLADGVHLDLRCDGEAYGGCQNACLIFWKSAWLKRIDSGERGAVSSERSRASGERGAASFSTALIVGNNDRASSLDPLNHRPLDLCTEADVLAGTRPENSIEKDVYTCQMTDVMKFTELLKWWDIRQYLEDYTSGNVTLGKMVRGFCYFGYRVVAGRRTVGRPFRWLYEKLFGVPWPKSYGTIQAGQPTPHCDLNLQPGELVRVKSYKEILLTLNTDGKNRGLSFDAEMVPYCCGTYRVRSRLTKFLDERTGKLITLSKSAIVLEKVWCGSRYSECRLFCPRALYSWWREIWLERVEENREDGKREDGG